MGHYASEMDPSWSQPSTSEMKFAEVEDEKVRALAATLFRGFNMGPHLDNFNSENGIRVAQAIDELIKARIGEALGLADQPQE